MLSSGSWLATFEASRIRPSPESGCLGLRIVFVVVADDARDEVVVARVDDLNAAYNNLSATYQRDKGKAGIPLD